MRYAVVIEKGSDGYGAYLPDLPGCVAVGDTVAEVRQLIREAVELHVQDLRDRGEPVPPPTTEVEHVDLQVA
jgi:predicted RNase H-like HicB family nuclease